MSRACNTRLRRIIINEHYANDETGTKFTKKA